MLRFGANQLIRRSFSERTKLQPARKHFIWFIWFASWRKTSIIMLCINAEYHAASSRHLQLSLLFPRLPWLELRQFPLVVVFLYRLVVEVPTNVSVVHSYSKYQTGRSSTKTRHFQSSARVLRASLHYLKLAFRHRASTFAFARQQRHVSEVEVWLALYVRLACSSLLHLPIQYS